MIEADRVDHSRAKLDHDLIVPITSGVPGRRRACRKADLGQDESEGEVVS